MSDLRLEHCLSRVHTLEAMVVALCVALPSERASIVLAVLDQAEDAIPPSAKMMREEYSRLLRDAFAPFREALSASVDPKLDLSSLLGKKNLPWTEVRNSF